ncbi:asparagine--tRNA ligase [bacterium]|nr:asparagine--tRNA ligase [bacterium]
MIRHFYENPPAFEKQTVHVSGWVRTVRDSRTFGFIELHDGSCFQNVQIVFGDQLGNFREITKLTIGSSLNVTGTLVPTPDAKQPFEIQASDIDIVSPASQENPIQKKRHSFEFLRTIAHLRPRTNTFNAVFRVRSILAYAIHKFFNERGFVYVHTPIITSVDAEGAGEMFQVTTLDPDKIKPPADYARELLGRKTFLTVSGQLPVEAFCMGFRNVYTFGPTFRAENSNTPRHASEFWMIEPEIAFADLEDDMKLAEDMMKFIFTHVLENAPDEMQFFDRFIEPGVIERLEKVIRSDFAAVTYTEAVGLLEKAGKDFEYPAAWGENLQTEHERYLSEEVFQKPVFVIDYPETIKAFYMYLNEDGKTVRAMDLLVPGVGEIIGGSQREDRFDLLLERMKKDGMSETVYDWYVDVRRFGSFPHAGFGLGFERALMYITGMKNIRDVIPYPRTPNQAAF